MADQKISADTTVTPAGADFFPILQGGANKKSTIASIPISTATQTALDAKQDTITGLTASGAELNILDGATLTTTELNYVDGVTSAIQTQLNAKQATLVSGTNIKTINSTSLLGSGDIVISGSGTVTATGGSLTANSVVLGAGTTDTKVVAGITTDGTSILNLGVNTTTIGKVKMFGNTSGDATIQPSAVAGTATVLTLPATTGTLLYTGVTLTGNDILLGNNTTSVKRGTAISTNGSGQIILGANGSILGSVKMLGDTSGDVTIQPTSVAGTATVQTLPATTGTLVNRVTTANGVSASNSDGALTVSLGAITPTTVNGHTFTTGSSTFTGTAAAVYTFPTATKTIAANDGSNMTLASQATGDIITASSGTALNRLADVAVGSVLVSGGVGVAPAYSANPQVTTVELGAATDTTLSRVSAGVIAVEGVTVPTISSTSTLTNKTLTAPIITYSINAQTGTTYTLVLTDQSKLVTLTNASAIAVTIPTNASVAFPIGTQIDFSQDGAGKATFSGAGVTINSLSSLKSIGGQYVGATLVKTATDTWNLYGNLIS